MASCCFTRNKLPKVPTNLSVPPTRPAGQTQQVVSYTHLTLPTILLV